MKKIYYGWYIVLICMVNNTFGIGIIPVMGLFTAPLMSRFGYSASSIGLTLSMLSVGMFCGYFFFGRILTKENNKLVLILCCGLQATSFLLMGITELKVIMLAYPLCFVIGFCAACTAISSPSIVNNWFISSNGLAMGIVGAGTGLSAFVLAPICSWLIYSSFGIRGGYFALAAGGLVSATLFYFFLYIEPSMKGLKPLGVKKETVETHASYTYDEVKGTGSFKRLVAARIMLSLIYTLCFVQVATHIINVGYSPSFSALIVSLYGASLIIGKVFIGILCDKIKLSTINLICYASLAVCALSAIFIEYNMALGYIYALCAGLSIPLQTVVYPIMIKDLYGTKDFPKLYAVNIQIAPLALAGGSYIAGLVYDVSNSYVPAFWLSLATVILAYSFVKQAYASHKKASLLPSPN